MKRVTLPYNKNLHDELLDGTEAAAAAAAEAEAAAAAEAAVAEAAEAVVLV